MTSNLSKFILLGVASTAMATLVACGGGNSAPVYGLTGVAATGLAITDAAVTVTCLSGSATSTTSATGFYGVAVTNGVGPCLVKVAKIGVPTLYSISPPTSTGSAIANVNQISNAIVNALVVTKGSGTVENLVTTAYAPKATDLTAAVTSTLTAINASLKAMNKPELPFGTDLLGKADFVAATSSSTPSKDPLDNALDALVADSSTTALPSGLESSINSAVASSGVKPNATGSTGSTGL
jgi:hypothetical protein